MAKGKQPDFFSYDGTCPITGVKIQSIAERKPPPAKKTKEISRERRKQKRAAAKPTSPFTTI